MNLLNIIILASSQIVNNEVEAAWDPLRAYWIRDRYGVEYDLFETGHGASIRFYLDQGGQCAGTKIYCEACSYRDDPKLNFHCVPNQNLVCSRKNSEFSQCRKADDGFNKPRIVTDYLGETYDLYETGRVKVRAYREKWEQCGGQANGFWDATIINWKCMPGQNLKCMYHNYRISQCRPANNPFPLHGQRDEKLFNHRRLNKVNNEALTDDKGDKIETLLAEDAGKENIKALLVDVGGIKNIEALLADDEEKKNIEALIADNAGKEKITALLADYVEKEDIKALFADDF